MTVTAPTLDHPAEAPSPTSAGTWDTAQATQFLYDGSHLIAEVDGTPGSSAQGAVLKTYTWDPTAAAGGLLAITTYNPNGSVAGRFQPVYDGHANITALVALDSGQVVASYSYSAFGQCTATGSMADVCPLRFGGMYWDQPSDLYHDQNRDYDPVLGRFIQRDPSGEASDPNLFAYCHNDPINRVDPNGMADAPATRPATRPAVRLPEPPPGYVYRTVYADYDDYHRGHIYTTRTKRILVPAPPPLFTPEQIIDSKWADAVRLGHMPKKSTDIPGFSVITEGDLVVGFTIDLTTHQLYSSSIETPKADVIVPADTYVGVIVGKGFIAISTNKPLILAVPYLTHIELSSVLFDEQGNFLRSNASGPGQSKVDAAIKQNLAQVALSAAKLVQLLQSVHDLRTQLDAVIREIAELDSWLKSLQK